MRAKIKRAAVATMLVLSSAATAQPVSDLRQAIDLALINNDGIKASEVQIEQARQMKRTFADPGRTSIQWMTGQYNSANTDNNFTISQSIPFPTTLARQSQLGKLSILDSEVRRDQAAVQLAYELKSEWYRLAYLLQREQLLETEDSVFEQVTRANEARVRAGEGRILDQLTAQTQWMEFVNMLTRNQADIRISRDRLNLLVGQSLEFAPTLVRHPTQANTESIASSPLLALAKLQASMAAKDRQLQVSRFLPDFSIGYFNQSLTGYQRPLNGTDVYYDKSQRFDGFVFGVSLPIWFTSQQARLNASQLQEEAMILRMQYQERVLTSELNQAHEDLSKQEASLEYYESIALNNSAMMITQAQKEYAAGQINMLEYLFATRNALLLRSSYYETLNSYNQVAARIEYLCGQY